MPSETFEQLLDRAASQCGIDPGYWDIWGRYHTISAAAKKSILRSMSVNANDRESLERSLAERTRREWERLLPPAVVVSESAGPQLPLSVPADSLDQRVHISICREDGHTAECEVNLWDLSQSESIQLEGRTWVRRQARIPISMPLGYHEISVKLGDTRATTRYIVTPDRAWSGLKEPGLKEPEPKSSVLKSADPQAAATAGRSAGIAVSLYGVRSSRNWGCGDFGDLLQMVEWVSEELQASFLGLNPLHAIHNRRPYNTSPYLPNCSFYRNFLYLDIEGMEDFANCRRARELREAAEVTAEIEALRAAPFVEYERISALKLRFLKLLFVQFLRERRTGSERARQFEAFRASEGDLIEKFATHSALDEYLHGRNPDLWLWPDWPKEYQDPSSPETLAFRKKHWRSVLFYEYLQWQIDIQLHRAQSRARERGLSIGLYHDLALATDRFGSDLWAHRPFYMSGCRVGSPPDDFAPKGQDWGFPPPNSERHREDGYRLFAESIRKNCRHGGALRFDHVMRFFRLYWIPDDSDATEGAYVRERSDDFVRILALESVRNQVIVVGEDLGTVEPEVRETLARFGILSYRLFYFEKNPQNGFRRHDEYPKGALVSSTTHDLPTLAGFWVGADIQARRAAGVLDDQGFREQTASRQVEKQKMLDVLFLQKLLPDGLPRLAPAYPELTGELHNAIVGFLAMTPSQLLAINEEDLTKELEQQNLPGTTWQYPNWGRKMRFTVEQLRSGEGRDFSAMFRNWIEKSGRKNVGR